MSNDDKKIESLIAGGLIGAALGALLSKKGEGTLLGAMAGAVFWATYKANEEARKTNVPMYVEEDGKLYEIQPGGKKTFIRNIRRKRHRTVPENFKLK